MTNTFAASLRDELLTLLTPLEASGSPAGFRALIASLGHADGLAGQTSLRDAVQQAATLVAELRELDPDQLATLEGAARVLQAAAKVFTAVRGVETAVTDPSLLSQARGFGEQMTNRMLALHLRARFHRLYNAASLLTLIAPAEMAKASSLVVTDGRIERFPWVDDQFKFDRIGDLLNRPWASLREAYLPNGMVRVDDAFDAADRLLPLIERFAAALGLRSNRDLLALDAAPLASDEPTFGDHFSDESQEETPPAADDSFETRRLRMPRATLSMPAANGAQQFGLSASLSSAEHEGGVAGVIFQFDSALAWSRTLTGWKLDFHSDGKVPALVVNPDGLQIAPIDAAASGGLSIARLDDGSGPVILGSAEGTRIEFGNPIFAVNFALSPSRKAIELAATVDHAALVITGNDGDGFLKSVLPVQGLRAEFEFGVILSSDLGLIFHGSAGLEAAIPVGLSVAGVTLSTVNLGLQAKDDRVNAEVSASIAASIGPIKAVLDRVGIESALSFPETGGNLGVADLDIGFKPPTGIGLSVDAQGVLTGSGFLFHDPARQLYAGALQLSLHDELTLSAYGLIATRLPDGRPGYSLLIFITADGFKPIPLGFGFMLQSIGGLVGIHRTFDHQVLKAGLKTDSLRTLLLPKDPVANAPALIQALAAAFPAQRGSYLLGLLARITWFTPTLVQMDLALIRELGARERLLVLGRVSALLPSQDNDLIRLNLDAVGVLDFDAGTLEADAVLVDSRLVHRFPITGSGALRARWPGAGRAEDGTALSGTHFVLAVGGLNPRFHAPAGFPALERVTLALCSGDNPRLICDAYFAITPNTVQFGAHASLHARAGKITVNGDLGFDALVTVLPPHFIVDFHASVQLKYKSHNLFKVALDGTLEGPLPLRIAARAKFEILWFSFSVRFEFTLAGARGTGTGPVSVSLEAELKKALRDPANWRTRRAPGVAHGVALRSLTRDAGLVLDPLGQLMVQQQLVPLNTQREIDTYGGAPVTGARRFSLAGGLQSAPSAPAQTVQGAFAPARYFTMSDDEKLAAPSFEQRDAGLVLGEGTVSFGPETTASLGYKTITVPPSSAEGAGGAALAAPEAAEPPVYELPWSQLQAQCPGGAAARAPVRSVGRERFRNTAATPVALLKAPAWRVVPASGAEARLGAEPGPGAWSDCHAALADLNRGGARWRMVPDYELAL